MVSIYAEAYRDFEKEDLEYIKKNHLFIGQLRKMVESANDEELKHEAGSLIHLLETNNVDLLEDLKYVRRTAEEIERICGGRSSNIEPGDASGI